jgi:hypothetical protein
MHWDTQIVVVADEPRVRVETRLYRPPTRTRWVSAVQQLDDQLIRIASTVAKKMVVSNGAAQYVRPSVKW